MKATIKGIDVEGTPQEIAQFIRIFEAQSTPIKYVNPLISPYQHLSDGSST